MGTSLPLAGVESSSMDHQIVIDYLSTLSLCGKEYLEKKYINFNEYWENCGEWYEKNNITKDEFSKFPFKNGFKKGDIVVVYGRFDPKIGDILIFTPNKDSIAPRPIVHRIVEINDKWIETKGDHNREQLIKTNNNFGTDEIHISESQIIGKVILRIPYLGWFKIWFMELFKFIFNK